MQVTVDQSRRKRPAGMEDEAFFRAVVRAHGPMVLATCRRIVVCPADAEDAFQATFLLFARNVKSIREERSLAAWLHRVAVRASLNLKVKKSKRLRHERGAAVMRKEDQEARQAWDDLRPVLDEELSLLPAKYRIPLVLCYLEGKNRDEAAAVMGIEAGSIKGLLERGREALRSKLVRRGIVIPAAVLAALLTSHAASAAVPTTLATTTATAGAALWAGAPLPAGIVSAKAVLLAASLKRSLRTTALKTVLIAAGTTLVVLWAVHGFSSQQHGGTSNSIASGQQAAATPVRPIEIVLQPEAAQLLTHQMAEVKVEGEWAKLEPSAKVYSPADWKDADRAWGPLPPELTGRSFTRFPMVHRVAGGRTQFTVMTNGVVVLACDRDFGGGGNSGGNWQPECITPTQLEQQGWQPYSESKDRVFYCRECKEGEAFTFRTQKYHPPILIR